MHNFISSFGSGTVINYGFRSDFLTSSSSGSLVKKLRFLRYRHHNTDPEIHGMTLRERIVSYVGPNVVCFKSELQHFFTVQYPS
jgi:hypothetical protein